MNREFVLYWPQGSTGYTLQSSTDLGSGLWTAVPGVTNNSAVVPITGAKQFFRLVK